MTPSRRATGEGGRPAEPGARPGKTLGGLEEPHEEAERFGAEQGHGAILEHFAQAAGEDEAP